MPKILITGALGQIGSELTFALVERYGENNVIATDIRQPLNDEYKHFEQLDVLDAESFKKILKKHSIDTVYHLAAMLSGVAEKFPVCAWDLNTKTLLTVLNFAKDGLIKNIFWPSSIAVYGRGAEKEGTPQSAIKNPESMYGIAKLAGERFCEYYYKKFNINVRSIRYPGLISWKTQPGGGTTDYAVDIFYQALENQKYDCFLNENTALPMLYMDDAIRGTIELMETPSENLSVHSSYNFSGLSFTPKELAEEIKKRIPAFEIEYLPDFRQSIADSWPNWIDDSVAQKDWGWKPEFDLPKMTDIMLQQLKLKLGKT
ncbi:Uncharacterized epimerase/dehydratase SAV0553 [Candidatus Ornithobacterium hominis]|uniref:NAD-dependent epimerase/dehydratase family protein n=1 Tax=Candidatus Ornithobacterium hominis TaxID=2497989 RepID=UPI000E5C2984|nr:NAD-dependent epimerase/dehydratase family protein [Candidatus Ornithobacterium hominis]SZD73771.1 Uncharacterized epimerase/dehydratase SAV0553 [Candidatus Ornithobacterium hominis]